jgi:hypothetical protein
MGGKPRNFIARALSQPSAAAPGPWKDETRIQPPPSAAAPGPWKDETRTQPPPPANLPTCQRAQRGPTRRIQLETLPGPFLRERSICGMIRALYLSRTELSGIRAIQRLLQSHFCSFSAWCAERGARIREERTSAGALSYFLVTQNVPCRPSQRRARLCQQGELSGLFD